MQQTMIKTGIVSVELQFILVKRACTRKKWSMALSAMHILAPMYHTILAHALFEPL